MQAVASTLGEFLKVAFGRHVTAQSVPRGIMLGVEKFKLADGKLYRLIWLSRRLARLAAEDETGYTTKAAAVEAGRRLARQAGVIFDERTR